MRTAATFVVGSIVAAATFAPTVARADATSDKAAAEALFDEGRRLMDSGHPEDACPKLAESQRLDPAAGTLLNLAACYERIGRVATAWVTYRDATRASAARRRADWEALARRKATALEPKVPHVTVTLAPTASAEGVTVTRDGAPMSRAELGVAIPVDPGHHVVEAAAPGKQTWTTEIDAVVGKNVDVAVPPLAAAATAATGAGDRSSPPSDVARPAATAAPPDDSRAPPAGSQRTIGWVVGAAGVALAGAGAVAGMLALGAKSDCEPYPDCRAKPGGPDANDRAHSMAMLSTIGVGVGVAAIVVGIVLVTTAHKATPSSTARASMLVGPGGFRTGPSSWQVVTW